METKMKIKYQDDFLSNFEYENIFDYCLNANYGYGERDNTDTPVTGMVHQIPVTELIYQTLSTKIEEKCSFLSEMNLYRMYVNCFAPNENPYFHTDGESGITFLYYLNEKYNIQDGGETQFLLDGDIYGVMPVSNRLVMFDANILHRATSFRDRHRFTIAIKYD